MDCSMGSVSHRVQGENHIVPTDRLSRMVYGACSRTRKAGVVPWWYVAATIIVRWSRSTSIGKSFESVSSLGRAQPSEQQLNEALHVEKVFTLHIANIRNIANVLERLRRIPEHPNHLRRSSNRPFRAMGLSKTLFTCLRRSSIRLRRSSRMLGNTRGRVSETLEPLLHRNPSPLALWNWARILRGGGCNSTAVTILFSFPIAFPSFILMFSFSRFPSRLSSFVRLSCCLCHCRRQLGSVPFSLTLW
jgi:hypothetical protein